MSEGAVGGWTPELIRELRHDLRNGLTGVMGFAQLLKRTDLDEQQQAYVREVLEGGTRLLDLIDGIPDTVAPAGVEVLYIEDDVSNITLIEAILSHRPEVGFRSAGDAAGGLRAIRERIPTLVLLDLGLPDRPGLEVLEELRADPATSSVPVVVLSGDRSPATIETLTEAGAMAYLTKPLDVVEFLELLEQFTG